MSKKGIFNRQSEHELELRDKAFVYYMSKDISGASFIERLQQRDIGWLNDSIVRCGYRRKQDLIINRSINSKSYWIPTGRGSRGCDNFGLCFWPPSFNTTAGHIMFPAKLTWLWDQIVNALPKLVAQKLMYTFPFRPRHVTQRNFPVLPNLLFPCGFFKFTLFLPDKPIITEEQAYGCGLKVSIRSSGKEGFCSNTISELVVTDLDWICEKFSTVWGL